MATPRDVGALQTGGIDVGALQSSGGGGTTPLTVSVSDSFSLSDGFTLVLSFLLPTSSDSFSLVDQIETDLEVSIIITVSVADSFTLTDGTPVTDIESPIFDNLTFSDSISVLLIGLISVGVFDTLTFGDSLSNPAQISIQVGDSINLVDYQIYNGYRFIDTLFFFDSVFLFFGGAQVEDQFILVDGIQITVGVVKSVSDSFSPVDGAIVPIVNVPISVGDFFIIGDILAVAGPKENEFEDNLLFTDALAIFINGYSFQESLGLADSAQVSVGIPSPAAAFADSFSLSDSITVSFLSVVLTVHVVDSFSMADAVAETVPVIPDNNNYYRRYLNDVKGVPNP